MFIVMNDTANRGELSVDTGATCQASEVLLNVVACRRTSTSAWMRKGGSNLRALEIAHGAVQHGTLRKVNPYAPPVWAGS